MNGFKAYKYYMAIKLHFTNPKFDVFVNRGHVKGSYDAFAQRNDRQLFEKIAIKYPDDREYILVLAANFMYGNPNVVYNVEDAQANYNEFVRRRQSMTYIFKNDLDTIAHSGAKYDFSGPQLPIVVQLLLANKITIETAVILNNIEQFVAKVKTTPLALILADDLMRIEKSTKFVKYNHDRAIGAYQQFLQEVKV